MNQRTFSVQTLHRASARIRELRSMPIVVKLGGSAMEQPHATNAVLKSCVTLQALGVKLVVVHGGGKPIDRAMADAGIEVKKVSGIRYTDPATLEIVVRVLKQINENLHQQFIGLNGVSFLHANDAKAWPIRGERLMLPGLDLQPLDIGLVGKVTAVDKSIDQALAKGLVPILPSLAVSSDSGWLNVNADLVASAIGGAVKAKSVYFLTDTPGVLRDRNKPESLIAHLTESQARDLIVEGVIAGGMIPKVEACFEALSFGIERAIILDGRDEGSLLAEFASDEPCGTVITR